jgi:hypothetical protein
MVDDGPGVAGKVSGVLVSGGDDGGWLDRYRRLIL